MDFYQIRSQYLTTEQIRIFQKKEQKQSAKIFFRKMMNENVSRFNQKGFCKFGDTCIQVHVNEMREIQGCNRSRCRKRHPKLCRYFAERNYSKFGHECSFKHHDNDNSVNVKQFQSLDENIKNIKAEMDVLKNTLKTLSNIKQEERILKNSVENQKDEIKRKRAENVDIKKKI